MPAGALIPVLLLLAGGAPAGAPGPPDLRDYPIEIGDPGGIGGGGGRYRNCTEPWSSAGRTYCVSYDGSPAAVVGGGRPKHCETGETSEVAYGKAVEWKRQNCQ